MNSHGTPRATRGPLPVAARIALALAVVAPVLTAGTIASAYWRSTGSADAVVTTATLAAPTDVVATPSVGAPPIHLAWTAGGGGVEPEGYYVTRQSGATSSPACASSPQALLHTSTCVDDAPGGQTVRYVVTAVRATWTATSAPSEDVVVLNDLAVTSTTLAEGMVDDAYTAVLTASGGGRPLRLVRVRTAVRVEPRQGDWRLVGNPDHAGYFDPRGHGHGRVGELGYPQRGPDDRPCAVDHHGHPARRAR